jgi:hypothetical protein
MSPAFRVLFPGEEEPQLSLGQAIDLYLAEKTLCFQAGGFSARSLDRAKYYLRDFDTRLPPRPAPQVQQTLAARAQPTQLG